HRPPHPHPRRSGSAGRPLRVGRRDAGRAAAAERPAAVGEWKPVTVPCGAVAEVAAAAPPEPERPYRQVHGLATLARGGLQAVVGDTVTCAMALQAHAALGTVQCSGATADLVRGLVQLVPQAPVAAGERSISMAVYQVTRRRGRQPSRWGPPTRPFRPLVGRA